ncbi:unnamed protein product [Rhizoctonia solani]|uniref:Uncharacterized protein n=1 Tax=Rhizoctonia solani TaxID=456999 RepID=A0A8H3I3J0_9AGAM|nr:unnamed protein product [Rhizoctonia solani]
MPRAYDHLVWTEALSATSDITALVQPYKVTQDQYEEAGLGGSADVFSGQYTKPDGNVTKASLLNEISFKAHWEIHQVAIKCIRAFDGIDDSIRLERLKKKLARELEIWRNLSGGDNIIELMGIITGIGPLPSFVCELCPWNLQDVSGSP